MAAAWFSAPAPATRRVRCYFAPVNRSTQAPTIFDAGEQGDFDLDAPPSPWISLGWINQFVRKPLGITAPVLTGIPAATLEHVRQSISAEITLEFAAWTKLTMALATGSQHMNVLAAQIGAPARATGAQAVAAVPVQSNSTATFIALPSEDAAKFAPGAIVGVDCDYTGQTGFVGTGVAGAYVRKPLTDVDYVRRVTFNVSLVAEVSQGGLTLATALPGGIPGPGAKLQAVNGFVDREGGSFFHEWSALFVMEGSQGERIFFHYPRLQNMSGAEESMASLDGKSSDGYACVKLKGQYKALPVTDPLDGERALCYRSFLPAPNALI
jgi:hypothetical protein